MPVGSHGAEGIRHLVVQVILEQQALSCLEAGPNGQAGHHRSAAAAIVATPERTSSTDTAPAVTTSPRVRMPPTSGPSTTLASTRRVGHHRSR